MRVQLDRFEDGGWAVLTVLSGDRSFDVPVEILPKGASPGDVFDLTLQRDDETTECIASENERLMEELLGSEGREDT